MRKLLLAQVAALAVTMAGPAVAADMPVAAAAPIQARFNWTGCYVGGHLGGASATKDITDPVQLVQDSFLGAGTTVGVTTVSPNPSGIVIGGQIGCDYEFEVIPGDRCRGVRIGLNHETHHDGRVAAWQSRHCAGEGKHRFSS